MKVAVTGGTGFVGSHSVKALRDAGHEVRLLVRDRSRLAGAFEPLGEEIPTDVIVGDVTTPADIEALLAGCDAVVHAASIFSLDSRHATRIRNTNVTGTRLVIETARRLGLDPIVHVSSVVAIVPADGPVGPDAPITTRAAGLYGQSKADSEALAREHQAEGAPVVTVMPGSVWGPHDPYFGESDRLAADFLKGMIRTLPSGGTIGIVDVRDVAATIAATIEPGKGPRRYAACPHHLSLAELKDALNQATGRNIRTLSLPAAVVAASVAPVALIQRLLPVRLPVSTEAIKLSAGFVPVDSSRVANELGVIWHPLSETMADTITAMVERGQLAPKYAGKLAPQGA